MSWRNYIPIKSKERLLGYFLILLIFSSCVQERQDYSIFPSGSILRGELEDGRSLYLVRNKDTHNMSGIGFFYNNESVIKKFPYTAESDGKGVFYIEEEMIKYTLSVDTVSQLLTLRIPDIDFYSIEAQSLSLGLVDSVTESRDIPERYRKPVIDEIESHQDVQYGSALGYYNSKPIDKVPNDDYGRIVFEILDGFGRQIIPKGASELPLHMDIYTPANDEHQSRPLFLFVHGGGFFFGDKKSQLQQQITEHLVSLGYVVASINYRIGLPFLTPDEIERAIYRGVQDTRAAIRYLTHHKEEYRIDPNQIYLGGSSAGGIIALTTAFMDRTEVFDTCCERDYLFGLVSRSDLGGLDDSGNAFDVDVNIAGVVSMWGALVDMSIIDNEIPTLLFHGTDDEVVRNDAGLPFKKQMGDALHSFLTRSWMLYGSLSIEEYMKNREMEISYVPFSGYGHEPQVDSDGTCNRNMDIIKENLMEYLYNNLTSYCLNSQLEAYSDNSDKVENLFYTTNDDRTTIWHVEGGVIVERKKNSIKVAWFDVTEKGRVEAYMQDDNAVWFKFEKEIKI